MTDRSPTDRSPTDRSPTDRSPTDRSPTDRSPTDRSPTGPGATDDVKSVSSASLFDLRTVIAVLFGIYGVILTIMGLLGTSQADLEKAGGIALNLWTGIGMLVVAGLFVTWLLLRPAITADPPGDGG